MFPTGCVVEEIDRILAERGVTECTTSTGLSSSTQGSSSSGTTSTGGEADDTSESSSGMTVPADDTSTDADETTEDSTTDGAAVCGNGIVEPGEDCDDETTYCNTSCIKSRFVFVTSEPTLQAGAIDGLIGADYECRHRAAILNFPNADRYRAWISTSTVDARDRVEHHPGRYILVNGLVVAENWEEFASGTHQNPINVTEKSQTFAEVVWTGTQTDGTRVPGESHCQDWTSSSDLEVAFTGDSSLADASWTLDQVLNPRKCGNAFALYCIEQ